MFRTLLNPSAAIPALAATLLLAAGCASTSSSGASAASAAPQGPMDMDALMARMGELAAPGEEHARLAAAVGTWNVEGSSYFEPGGEPTPMVATAVTTSSLGGRLIEETFTMDFMGEAFEGRLLQGYDNLKEEYWSIWFDSMSTWGSYSTGNYNAAGNLVFEGLMYDAMTPEGRTVRQVIREIDANKQNMKMYDVMADGSANLTMDLTYTRAW